MKRDLGVVRKLLLQAEKSENRFFEMGEWSWTDHDMRQRELTSDLSTEELFHIDLMEQGGLVRKSFDDHSDCQYWEITWAGYDFIDAVRQESVWNRTKALVAEEGGNFTIELAKSLAVGLVKKQIEDRTGLKL